MNFERPRMPSPEPETKPDSDKGHEAYPEAHIDLTKLAALKEDLRRATDAWDIDKKGVVATEEHAFLTDKKKEIYEERVKLADQSRREVSRIEHELSDLEDKIAAKKEKFELKQ